MLTHHPPIEGGVEMKIVKPQQQTLFEFSVNAGGAATYHQFSKTFKSIDLPMECQIVLSNATVGQWYVGVLFDSLSLVSP